jgi:hypothetical protein
MSGADAGEEDAEEIGDFGDGPDGGSRVSAAGFLLDGDGRGESVDAVDLGFGELGEELASVGGEGFDIAALAFGEEGIEGHGGFSGAGDASEADESATGEVEGDVAEVMFASATDLDDFLRHDPRVSRSEVERKRIIAGARRCPPDQWKGGWFESGRGW